MTRFLLASVFTLALCSPAFAASDAEIRNLALQFQESDISADNIDGNNALPFVKDSDMIAGRTQASEELLNVNEAAIGSVAMTSEDDITAGEPANRVIGPPRPVEYMPLQ